MLFFFPGRAGSACIPNGDWIQGSQVSQPQPCFSQGCPVQQSPGLQAEEVSSSSLAEEEPQVAIFADEFPQKVVGFGN